MFAFQNQLLHFVLSEISEKYNRSQNETYETDNILSFTLLIFLPYVEPTFVAAIAAKVRWSNLVPKFVAVVERHLQMLEQGFTFLWLHLLLHQKMVQPTAEFLTVYITFVCITE